MARYLSAKTICEDQLDEIWRDRVNIGARYVIDHHKILDALSEFAHSLDSYLRRVNMAKPPTELSKLGLHDADPASQLSGPKTREYETGKSTKCCTCTLLVVETAQSEWVSLVVFPSKMDGSLRFCIEYWKLNTVTLKDVYPIPCMDECLDSPSKVCIFSRLDANSRFCQSRSTTLTEIGRFSHSITDCTDFSTCRSVSRTP